MELIGRQDSAVFGSDSREELRWIGKPWRRIELMRNRFFYKGEQIECARDLSLHVGSRRFGLAVTVTFTQASVLDYSDSAQ